MEVRLSELRYREVINISDGTRLGFVSDAILDLTGGRVSFRPGPRAVTADNPSKTGE